jgi:hypothetical protein
LGGGFYLLNTVVCLLGKFVITKSKLMLKYSLTLFYVCVDISMPSFFIVDIAFGVTPRVSTPALKISAF